MRLSWPGLKPLLETRDGLLHDLGCSTANVDLSILSGSFPVFSFRDCHRQIRCIQHGKIDPDTDGRHQVRGVSHEIQALLRLPLETQRQLIDRPLDIFFTSIQKIPELRRPSVEHREHEIAHALSFCFQAYPIARPFDCRIDAYATVAVALRKNRFRFSERKHRAMTDKAGLCR